MAFCYDMLQDIKRSIKEDCTVEYKNYILLQRKLKEENDRETSTFIERTQGAEMSLFIENVYKVASSSEQTQNSFTGDVDLLVKQIFERKKLIEKVEKENENEENNFMNNVIGGSQEDEFTAYTGSTKDTKNAARIRHSVDVKEDVAFRKILKNIPQIAKSGGKLKDRIRESISINPKSFLNENGFFKSPTNGSMLPKNLLEKAFNQLKYKKMKTLNSEEHFSDDSSDFEFCKSSRKYRELDRLQYNESVTSNKTNERTTRKFDSVGTIQNEGLMNQSITKSSINWGSFYHQSLQRKSPTIQTIDQSNVGGVQISSMAKRRKFQMKQLSSIASQHSNRYSVSRIDSNSINSKRSLIKDFMLKTPSINIMPLKGLKDNILKVSAMASTVKKMQDF